MKCGDRCEGVTWKCGRGSAVEILCKLQVTGKHFTASHPTL